MAQPFAEFIGNKRLLWIAEEWHRYADELAEWAMERLVNRRDVWSQYTLRNGEVGVVMLPIKERRDLGTDMITLTKLKRHFAGRAVSHLIGLHSISDRGTQNGLPSMSIFITKISQIRMRLLLPILKPVSNGLNDFAKNLWIRFSLIATVSAGFI